MKIIGLIVIMIFLANGDAFAKKEKSLKQLKVDLRKIEQSIKTTKHKMKTLEDVRFLPDVYFVLAEFYIEKSQYMYNIKIMSNKDVPEAELDFTLEKRPKEEAIAVYESYLDKFPNHEGRDRALFFMGTEYRSLGRLEEMVATFEKLTRQFPKSQFWAESKLVLGDHYYEQIKDVDSALDHYKEITKKSTGPFTPLAWYKIGLCQFDLEKYEKSFLAHRQSLLSSRDVDMDKLPEVHRRTDIRLSALQKIVNPFSELTKKQRKKTLGKYNKFPHLYFRDLAYSEKSYRIVLKRLAVRMNIKKNYKDEAYAYRELLKVERDVEERVSLMENYYAVLRNHLKWWPENFVELSTKLAVKVRYSAKFKKKEKKTYLKNLEMFARDAATTTNKKAKNKGSKELYSRSANEYELYLWAFPRTKYSRKMRLNMAESYFNARKQLKAAMSYEKAARVSKDKKIKKSYYDSSLESYTGVLKNPTKWNRLQLVQARNGLRGLGSVYFKNYKRDSSIPSLLFNIGQSYYDERSFNKAVKAFKKYIAKFPSDANVSMAANLMLDAHNQRENYSALIKDGMAIVNNKRLKNSSLKANIREIVTQARIGKVRKRSRNTASADYAKDLIAFAKKYKGDVGDQALYEAFITLKSQKDPRAYIPGEELLKKHGKSKYVKIVVVEMGKLSMVTADYIRAAKYFEMYYSKYPKEKDSVQFLNQAATLREYLGQYKKAKIDYQRLGYFDNAAKMDYLAKDWSSLLKSGTKSTLRGNYYLGVANYNLGKKGHAYKYFRNVQGGQNNEDMGHAYYLLANKELELYKRVKMRAGKEAAAIQKKNAQLEGLVQRYNAVINSGSGKWTIASLFGLGLAYKEFGDFVKNAPIPSSLTGAQKKQYKAALKKQASGYYKSGKEYFKKCLNSAEKFEVFTDFVKGCKSNGKKNVSLRSSKRNMASNIQPTKKARQIQKKLYRKPRSVGLLEKLADEYIKSENYSMAIAILNRGLEIKPNDSNLLAKIGTAYLYLEDFNEAGSWFKKSLKSKSSNKLALWSLTGLYKKFEFKKKFKKMIARAKRSGKPSGVVHRIAKAAY